MGRGATGRDGEEEAGRVDRNEGSGRGRWSEGNREGATGMGRRATRRGRWEGGNWKWEVGRWAKGMGEEGARGGGISQMDMEYLAEADRMPGATEAMAFTDSYKHMECLGGMRLQSF